MHCIPVQGISIFFIKIQIIAIKKVYKLIAQDQLKQGRGYTLNRFYLFENDDKCELDCPSDSNLIVKPSKKFKNMTYIQEREWTKNGHFYILIKTVKHYIFSPFI